MHVRIDSSSLLAAAKRLQPFTCRSSRNMSILGGVRLDAAVSLDGENAGRFEVEATNLSTAVRAGVTAKVLRTGEFVVDAAALIKALAGLAGDLELEVVGGLLKISAGARVVRLQGLDSKDWPKLPRAQLHALLAVADVEGSYPCLTLADLISRPLAAVLSDAQAATFERADKFKDKDGADERDAQRRGLLHLLLRFDGKRASATGCNGHMAIQSVMPCHNVVGDTLIPRDEAKRIAQTLRTCTGLPWVGELKIDEADVEVTRSFARRFLVINAGQLEIYVRASPVQAAKFPVLQWPAEARTTLEVDTSKLFASAKWLSSMAPASKIAEFVVGVLGRDRLQIRVDDPDVGESMDMLEIEVSHRGKTADLVWRMSIEYTAIAADALASDAVEIRLWSAEQPVVLEQGEQGCVPRVRALIMPCKV